MSNHRNQMNDIIPGNTSETRIMQFLKAVPHLEFSEKGIENICKRFEITKEELRERIQSVNNINQLISQP